MRDERSLTLISGSNPGTHDFGYVCHLPRRVLVENLTVDDSSITNSSYSGPSVFNDFHRHGTASELLPYPPTEEVQAKNVRVASNKQLKLSSNTQLFRDTKMTLTSK